jgi:prolyl-tRNA synthetase
MVMGCYGIGITRCVAAVIEQHSDEKGIIWPMSVAPAHCIIVIVNTTDERQREAGESLYCRMKEAGIEVILDDRDERPGVKFNDADLIGIPIRITIGPKALDKGCFELKERQDKEARLVETEKAVEEVKTLISKGLDKLNPDKR